MESTRAAVMVPALCALPGKQWTRKVDLSVAVRRCTLSTELAKANTPGQSS